MMIKSGVFCYDDEDDEDDEEADNVDDDEDSNNEIKVEERSWLEKAVHSSIFSAHETLECPHVWSGDVTRPSLIQESRYNCQQGRQALGVQCVAKYSFYRRLLVPKFEHIRKQDEVF